MNLKCARCGTPIEISPEITASPQPRVTCPRCHSRYRLRRRSPAPAPSTAAPQAAGTPAAGATATGTPAAGTPAAGTPAAGTPAAGTPAAAPPAPTFAPGEVLAQRYRILRFLAQGGMGEVYEAEDLELRERLALKTISARVAADGSGAGAGAAIDRFKREISLARKVTHPNVCRIFDLGQHWPTDGRPGVNFLTMELLAGETLAQCLRRRGRLTTDEALPLARQVAAALDAAHRAQVVHRDLKSENIILVRAGAAIRAVVTDFGIARGGREDQFAAMVTGTGVVGTPAYMAPEQVEGLPVTAAADIYAFGVVLYEMVTGRLPFEGASPLTMAAKRLQEPPRPPHVHVPDLDVRWEKAILRCLERRGEQRFATAGDAIAVIEAAPARPPRAAGQVPETLWLERASGAPVGGPRHDSRVAQPAPTGARPAAPVAVPAPAPPAAPAAPVASARPRSSLLVPLLALLALVAALAAGLKFLTPDAEPHRAPRRSVAVVGFQNLSGQADHAWLATALTEMLGTELTRGDGLRAIPGDQVARMKQELALGKMTELSAERLRQVHAVLGCDFVLAGSFVAAPRQLRIDLRLADAAVGAPLASFAQEGSDADLFTLVKALGGEVRDRLGVGVDGTAEDPLAGLPRRREAARLYSEALDRLRRSEPRAACEALEEAARIEPENPLIHSALSSAWQALGYGQRAAEEARRAFELSSELSREDRLVVEGRYRETQGDWPAAVRLYRTLWNFFPDNLEYGLRLAAAQTAARQAGDALATVARLRELPPPSSEDVRIDLAEGAAAALAADYRRQLAAAQRGGRRAEDLGAALLAAQARIVEAQAYRFLGQARDSARAARKAAQLYDQVGHAAGSALALTTEANAHFDLADFGEAIARFEAAIATYREIGDEGGLASALNNLALALKNKGDLDRTRALYAEAAEIYESTGNRLGMANALNNRATLLILRDELAAAREMFERARDIWREAGDPSGQAYALNNLAVVRRLEGDLAVSRALNEEALAIRREIGQKVGEVFSLANLGGVLADLGELGRAEATLAEGRRLAEKMGHRSALAYCLFELAELRLVQGHLDDAQRLHKEVLALRQELDEKQAVADSRAALARLQLEKGEGAVAELEARHAASAFGAGERRAEQGRATAYLALALLDQRLLEEARRMVDDARNLGGASETLAIRFRIRFADAKVTAAGGRRREAQRKLAELESEAGRAGFAALVFEARLAQAETELLAGRSFAAAEQLRTLQGDAAFQGFGWISDRAAALLHGVG